MASPNATPISKIVGARVIADGILPDAQYDISISDSTIAAIQPHDAASLSDDASVINARDCLVGPSLCHAHIHLDKCFILNDVKYADLAVEEGGFQEALELTAKAKQRFQEDDLLRRGRWLIEESLAFGVTHMRAFVEVDSTVEMKCLNAAIKLKEQYQHVCRIQICAFAQDPIFSGEPAQRNRDLLAATLENPAVEALGTTPYVEDSDENSKMNIDWAISNAISHHRHLDFHLDYFLDKKQAPMFEYVVPHTMIQSFPESNPNKHITLGHCTYQTLYTEKDWQNIAPHFSTLPISIIGLPSSDLFIMAKPDLPTVKDRVRGTLQIPSLIQRHTISAAIALNNVGNAFTPYGGCDPLALASSCVGIYQAGTTKDAAVLHECVTQRAKVAVGLLPPPPLSLSRWGEGFSLKVGDAADLVVYGSPRGKRSDAGERSGRREKRNVHHLICDPPRERMTVFGGRLVGGTDN